MQRQLNRVDENFFAVRNVLTDATAYVQQEVLKGGSALYMKWVTKRNCNNVFQNRLIVVSNDYRIYSLKKTLVGKMAVQREGHLFDITQITSSEPNKMVIRFQGFDIDITETSVGDLLQTIANEYHKISNGFSKKVSIDWSIIPNTRLPTPQSFGKSVTSPRLNLIADFGPSKGLLNTYEAWCGYLNVKPQPAVTSYINDRTSNGSTDFVFSDLTGIDSDGSNGLMLRPLFLSLRSNPYFRSLRCNHVRREEIVLSVVNIMAANQYVNKLELIEMGASSDAFAALGHSLVNNPDHSLDEINLSGNKFSSKAAKALGDGLQHTNRSLVRFILAGCSMSPKASQLLLSGLSYGREVTKFLTTLDLSNNNLGETGCTELSSWLGRLTSQTFNSINLMNTKVDVGQIFRALVNNTNKMPISYLNLSGNLVDDSVVYSVTKFISDSSTLKHIIFSHCKMKSLTGSLIIKSVTTNVKLRDVSLDISFNPIGVDRAVPIAPALSENQNITRLYMQNCSFQKKHLSKMIDGLISNRGLELLDLSWNFRQGTASKMTSLCQSIATLIRQHPTIRHLAIAGDNGRHSIGKDLATIATVLAANPQLEELVLTGNRGGDNFVLALAEAMRSNTRLKALYWDYNGITCMGWTALSNAMTQNKTLSYLPTPQHDLESLSGDREIERGRDILDKIQSQIKQNEYSIGIFSSAYFAYNSESHMMTTLQQQKSRDKLPSSHQVSHDPMSPNQQAEPWSDPVLSDNVWSDNVWSDNEDQNYHEHDYHQGYQEEYQEGYDQGYY
ncbi:hypothetical protein PROFUN_05745 [Planoprotostelium fungivorum]|uniref:Leucine Rich Repeat family protein n=1 Tax=Planoprotostelium fungivorum TaxID=1890364 RepID=A0A2P6NQJ7_9EUKA|nr:hypothetical protein PROFUN_05745 [Planoprotostelium fungivorum]